MSYNNNWNWSWVVSLGICTSIAYKNCEKNDFKSKLESNPTISPNYTPYNPEIKAPKINTSKIPPANYELRSNSAAESEKTNFIDIVDWHNSKEFQDGIKDLKSIKGLDYVDMINGRDYVNNAPNNNQFELKVPPLNKNNSIDLVEPINPNFSNNSNKHFK